MNDEGIRILRRWVEWSPETFVLEGVEHCRYCGIRVPQHITDKTRWVRTGKNHYPRCQYRRAKEYLARVARGREHGQ